MKGNGYAGANPAVPTNNKHTNKRKRRQMKLREDCCYKLETTRLFLNISEDPVLRHEAMRVVKNAKKKGLGDDEAIRDWVYEWLEIKDNGAPNELRINIGSLWRIDWRIITDALSKDKLFR